MRRQVYCHAERSEASDIRSEMPIIYIWINEERYEKLQQIGLASMTKDVLAGMKVLQIHCNEQQKDELLSLYPMAKFDSATTKSIELLPADVKNRMFGLVIEHKTLNVMDKFLT